MEVYLRSQHKNDVLTILESQNVKEVPFKALKVDLKLLKTKNAELYNQLNSNVFEVRRLWSEALNVVQREILEMHRDLCRDSVVKESFKVTFVNHPETGEKLEPYEPYFSKLWKFMQIEGSVLRSKEWRKQEIVKEFRCRKCKLDFKLHADRIVQFHFTIPKMCPKSDCKGTVYEREGVNGEVDLNNFMDYQEVTVLPYDKPTMLTVELDEELVESCLIGDRVTICGIYEMRSEKGINDNHRIVMRAVSLIVHDQQQKMNFDPLIMNIMVRDEWQRDLRETENKEFAIRDVMVNSVAPLVDGLALAKLGVMLTLCSGGESIDEDKKASSETVREIAHLLFIGDPGLGKSQLLKAAAEISVKSVKTVGYSATTAGLTASCYTEKGETHLEAGALVKANNGVCCIDEINLMSKEHLGCIHEVMESQKITINKAGFSGKIGAKCSIIAAMNQKNSNIAIDAKNIAMEGSLMSRFDLVFELLDPRSEKFDAKMFNFITSSLSESERNDSAAKWSLERLQTHILVAKDIRVVMTEPVKMILHKYYIFCKNNEDVDRSRKTPRLFHSLERLTMCHAKLMLRSRTEIMDAVTVVMLMESSWSFGHLMPQTSIVLSEIPLGPTNEYFVRVLEKLSLESLLDEEVEVETSKHQSQPRSQHSQPFGPINLEDIFNDSSDSAEMSGVETEENDYIFSTQAINRLTSFQSTQQLKSQDMDFDDSVCFTPSTQSSSTQLTSKTEKRGSTLDLFVEESKKRKVDEVPKQVACDPLRDNLNTLAALFAGNSSTSSKPSPPVDPVKQQSSFNKLKKYQFNELESTLSPDGEKRHDENVSSTAQKDGPKNPSEAEPVKKSLAEAAKEIDIWGDFD